MRLPAGGLTASMAASAALSRSKRASSFSIATGVGRSPRLLHPGREDRLEPVPVLDVLPQVRVGRVRLGSQVEQVERPPRGPRQVSGDRRDDAPRGSGHQHGAVRTERIAPSDGASCGGKGRARRGPPPSAGRRRGRPRHSPGRAASPRRGAPPPPSVSRLRGRSTALTRASGSLPLVGLREAGHGSAHRGRRTGVVVPVEAAEAGAGDQEGASS